MRPTHRLRGRGRQARPVRLRALLVLPRPGFTLVELLVVLVIVLLISAVALAAYAHYGRSQAITSAARILSASIAGARDLAGPSGGAGLRFLPDASTVSYAGGQIDPTAQLTYRAALPLKPGPSYSSGLVNTGLPLPQGFAAPYPCLVVEQSPIDAEGLPCEPTSWFWKVRVGDTITVGQHPYTVVGPLAITPWSASPGNPDLAVNDGPPGSPPQLTRTVITPTGRVSVPVEYLFLVNGRDDDRNGFVDDGWDGVDNNVNLQVDELLEWETETWQGFDGALSATPYTIVSRPIPDSSRPPITLPLGVVIDASTVWTTQERTRAPINRYTGVLDLIWNARGELEPSIPYGVPSSIGLSSSYVSLWLASQEDLAPLEGTSAPLLPVGEIGRQTTWTGRRLTHAYGVITIPLRTGAPRYVADPWFADPAVQPYTTLTPFLPGMRGVDQ